MNEYKVIKMYGEDDFSRLFERLVEAKIEKISYLIKEEVNSGNKIDNSTSICKDIEEGVIK